MGHTLISVSLVSFTSICTHLCLGSRCCEEAQRKHEKAHQSLCSETGEDSEEDQEHHESGSWKVTDEGDDDYDDSVNNELVSTQ